MLTELKTISGFAADDVDAAAAFYGDRLGLETSRNEMGILVLHLGDGREVIVYPSPGLTPPSYTILNFQTDDVPGTVAALRERGVAFERYEDSPTPTDEDFVFRGGGPLIAWFKDPSGNTLSIIQA